MSGFGDFMKNVALASVPLPSKDQSGKLTGINVGGSFIAMNGAPLLKPAMVLKRFTDSRNVTLTNGTGMSSVSSIDQNSPYGGAALKVVLTADSAGTRTFDVILNNMNIKNFDGNVATDVWVDDPLKITQFTTYIGNANLVLYNQYNRTIAAGGELVGASRQIEAGAAFAPAVNTFTFGVDSLQQLKFRVSVSAGQTVTLWFRDMKVMDNGNRPIIVFTYDDSYANWPTRVIPIAATYRIPLTFAVNTEAILAGTGGVNLLPSDIPPIIAAGHQIGSHNVSNYKLQRLYANGNGEDNGTGTSQDATTYAAYYATAKAYLSSLGVPSSHFCYHAWVQGGCDNASVEYLRSEGVDIARNIGAPNSINLYGFEMGNNAYSLRAFELGNANSLAACKAAVDQCIKYGGLLVFMGHNTGDTSSDSITFAESDLRSLMAYVAAYRDSGQCDVMRMMDLRDRLNAMGLLNRPKTNPKPVSRQIGRRLAANFNSAADQQIFLVPGNFVITSIAVAKPSIPLSVAAGGFYTGAGKSGQVLVPSSQAYSGATAATSVVLTAVDDTVAKANPVTGSVYLSLSTPQGVAATADVFIFGYPV